MLAAILLTLALPMADAPKLDAARLDALDALVEAGIAKKQAPGAVLLVVHRDRVVYRKAFGQRAVEPTPAAMAPDAVFDLASLTKPVATATCVLLLVERGKLALADPVARHWPAFAAHGKEGVTIEECLLHTSGLVADNPIADYADGREAALAKVAGLKLVTPPGSKFAYSDVGFIALGEVVARVSGKSLDEFAAENVFAPLKMADTYFAAGNKPSERLAGRTAPTARRDGKAILGSVHDPRSYALGGVAGHAGLFSTADDLARFCRMLLRGGELDGVRVLKPETVKLLTEPVGVPGGEKAGGWLRSRGWDVQTGYSGQRGDAFPRGQGYGHTGFTGTSLWLDPESQTAVILLTSRLHPADGGNVADLRRKVGTLVGEALGHPAKPPAKP